MIPNFQVKKGTGDPVNFYSDLDKYNEMMKIDA